MDLKQLENFVAVMRQGSFSAVARERGVDPATISRSIQQLEKYLQLRLFQRTTRKIEPTEAAVVYFERVEPLVEALDRARLMAVDTRSHMSGVLRVSSPVSFAQLNLVPLLPEFSEQYPHIQFDLLLTDEDLDLVARQIDVGLRVGALQDSRLKGYKLCDMQAFVCATPHYLASRGHPQTPQELVEHPCLTLGYRGFTPGEWRFRHRVTGQLTTVRLQERLKTSNAMALKQCVLAHMGITLQARWMVGKELNAGSLMDVFPDYEVTSAEQEAAAWLLYPSRMYQADKVRAFIDYLKAKFAHGAPGER